MPVHFYADVLAENDLESALVEWFRGLPTPGSRDRAYRLIQTVIPHILAESMESVDLPPTKPVEYTPARPHPARPTIQSTGSYTQFIVMRPRRLPAANCLCAAKNGKLAGRAQQHVCV